MTIDEFFDKLAEATQERGLIWRIKRQSRSRPKAIREGCGPRFGQCPIAAVGVYLGKADRPEFYGNVADRIGLQSDDADAIAAAADFEPDFTELTKRLLKTCGLE